jgi:alpha-1,2-mannosyltransferase
MASVAFCGVLPALALIGLFAATIADDNVAFDFRPFYRAAGAILDGNSPYPAADDPLTAESGAYVYPPLAALAAIPLRVLPMDAAGLFVMALLACVALMTLYVLGVRDWRCYGVIFLWPPVLSAIQTGNLTLVLGLLAALTWRWRDRPAATAGALGVTLAAKFFLWPLVVWLAVTRRVAAARLACMVGIGVLIVSWGAIGFAGVTAYPELMRRLDDSVGLDSYTVYIVGLDLGLPSVAARVIWLAVGLSLVASIALVARRGDERSAFTLAMAAALALSPIVWLHYFALLIVVVALAQQRLSFVWFLPLAMVLTPGSGQPTPFETAWTLGVAGSVILLTLRASQTVAPPSGWRWSGSQEFEGT